MEKFLKAFSWIYGVAGTIVAIVMAYVSGKTSYVTTVKSYVSGTADYAHSGRNWLITIGVFLVIMISVLITSAVLSAVGNLIGRMDKIEYKVNVLEQSQPPV